MSRVVNVCICFGLILQEVLELHLLCLYAAVQFVNLLKVSEWVDPLA